MKRMAFRYLLYFALFILFVQLSDRPNVQLIFACLGLKLNLDLISLYAPLFLSVLLIDVTYQSGKRQNEIAEQQTEIAKKQYQSEVFEVYKEMHRDIYKLQQYSKIVLPRIYCYFASKTAKDQEKRVEDLERFFNDLAEKIAIDEADFFLRKGENKILVDIHSYTDFVALILGVTTAFTHKERPEQSDVMMLNNSQMQQRSDAEWIEAIKEHISDKRIIDLLLIFAKEKRRLFEEENILEKFQQACANETK